jgi:capsular polysaccharide export protein
LSDYGLAQNTGRLPGRIHSCFGPLGPTPDGQSERLEALLRPSSITAKPRSAACVLAWGLKPSAKRAARLASRLSLPLWRVEDAFIRSIGCGPAEPPLGLVFDDIGIYYDASRASRLEQIIRHPLDPVCDTRAVNLIELWREARVSKYNSAPDYESGLPEDFVLVVDQTLGDLSIEHGMADSGSFLRMLQTAITENPAAPVVLKTHPEVASGKKRGHFTRRNLQNLPRVILLDAEVHPVGLLERTRKVYTVTSQVGFEALLHGKPVRTFGMPFYAGWGLTEDELPAPARRGKASLNQLAHAALVDYARYVCPETGERCEVEHLIDCLGNHRRKLQSANTVSARRSLRSAEQTPNVVYAVGFEPWKKSLLRTFLPGKRVVFTGSPQQIPRGDKAEIATWGTRFADTDFPAGSRITRYEDGFIRSQGLGVRFAPAISWIADDIGIYYDASRPSKLEVILQNEPFPDDVVERARKLRGLIVEAGLTKYNLSGPAWRRPAGAGKVILVPGQVETDASVLLGSPSIRTNVALLQAVRAANPGAYIAYKPHPDVVSRLRKSGASEGHASAYCDAVVSSASILQLIEASDEVHVMTSLTGFEALLRGKPVVAYGQPFYAGWGLTKDMNPPPRRARRLTFDELVAGALLRYPLYRSPATGQVCGAEAAVRALADGKNALSPGPVERALAFMQQFSLWTRFWAK